MARQNLWTRDEVLLVMNLYCQIPFGKMHQSNPDVIKLAELIGRTPGAVAYKLVNLASFDPELKRRNIKGASNASKMDEKVWNEFHTNWNGLVLESELVKARYEGRSIEEKYAPEMTDKAELEREQLVKVRVNQSFFRNMMMAAYNSTCCITGINMPELLIAAHITPWGKDEANRLNPTNGLLLNALHDKAYECGLISVRPDYTIAVSGSLNKAESENTTQYFHKFDNKPIHLPTHFLPDKSFLEQHYHERFKP